MKPFDQSILDYLETQKICVLSVEMLDGSPHAATVHFAHQETPPIFFFETYRDYRKAEPLFGRDLTRASLVIGFDENNMKTLQMDGDVRLIKEDEKTLFDGIYLKKFPKKQEKSTDPKFVSFIFILRWWRFTDWTRPEGKMILVSE